MENKPLDSTSAPVPPASRLPRVLAGETRNGQSDSDELPPDRDVDETDPLERIYAPSEETATSDPAGEADAGYWEDQETGPEAEDVEAQETDAETGSSMADAEQAAEQEEYNEPAGDDDEEIEQGADEAEAGEQQDEDEPADEEEDESGAYEEDELELGPSHDPDADYPTLSVSSRKALQSTEVTEALPTPPPGRNPQGAARPSRKEEPIPSFSDFRIIKKIGEGAMGTVYRAYQISADQDVALKVMFAHRARVPKIVERFYREARIMGLLDHPHIVMAFGVGEEDGCHYLALEYVDGRSLQQWLGLLGKFSVGDALYVVLAAAYALEHAHSLDLVHRDIKPDNILLTRNGLVKVTDFGMVKLILEEVSLTQTGHGVGTPCYMPLEQARNAKDTDARSDIYALGCTLYCLLAGQPPFNQRTVVELIQAKELGVFPPARRFNPDVPERLDLIIAKMVSKSVQYRYQSCADVIHDLEALELAHETLSFIPSGGGKASSTVDELRAVSQRTSEAIPRAPKPVARTETPPECPSSTAAEEAGDWWYVRYRKKAGQRVTRKLTTAQVLDLIDSQDFDVKAQASHNLNTGYCPLSSIKEFKDRVMIRATRNEMVLRTTRTQSRYEKLVEAEGQRQEKREVKGRERDKDSRTTRRLLLGAILGALGIVVFLILRFLALQLIGIFH